MANSCEVSRIIKIFRLTTNLLYCFQEPTSEYEVEIVEIIADLNCNKSPGYLDITATLFKEAKFLIVQYLVNVGEAKIFDCGGP